MSTKGTVHTVLTEEGWGWCIQDTWGRGLMGHKFLFRFHQPEILHIFQQHKQSIEVITGTQDTQDSSVKETEQLRASVWTLRNLIETFSTMYAIKESGILCVLPVFWYRSDQRSVPVRANLTVSVQVDQHLENKHSVKEGEGKHKCRPKTGFWKLPQGNH